MPFEKKKHPYQHTEPVKIYDETHQAPQEVRTKIANFILGFAENTTRQVNILDAGIGEGSVVIIPLIQEAIQQGISLNIVGFDNSLEMLKRLAVNLGNAFPESEIKNGDKENSLFIEGEFGGKVSLSVYLADIETKESFDTFKDTVVDAKFDICLSFFLLHHLINWRHGLAELLNMVKNHGYFVYAERLNDIAAMDGDQKRLYELYKGTVDPTKKSFYETLKKFCDKRNNILVWNPEISATNYIAVDRAVSYFSYEEISLDDPAVLSYTYEITYDHFSKWVKSGAYTHFWWGLTNEEKKELAGEIKKQSKNIAEKIRIEDGLHIVAHRIYRKSETEVKGHLFTENFFNNNIIEKLHNPIDIRISKNHQVRYQSLKDLLALISTHDFMTPNTLWAFLTYWSLLVGENQYDVTNALRMREGMWVDEMPLSVIKLDGNNISQVIHNISYLVLYFILIKQFRFSITDFIYRDLPERPILIIHLGEDIHFDPPIRNWDGTLCKLSITIPPPRVATEAIPIVIQEIQKILQEWLQSGHGRVQETRGSIILFGWNDIMKKFEHYTPKWETLFDSTHFTSFESIFRKKLKDLAALDNITLFSATSKEDLQYLTKTLYTLSLVFSQTELTHVAYIGSETVKRTDEYGNPQNYGFGGAIIGEAISKDETEIKYFETRCRLLRAILNRRYSQFGIGEYAEKQIRDTYILNKLLSDFQHTLLQKVLETVEMCGSEMVEKRVSMNNKDFKRYYSDPFATLCRHIKVRGMYLAQLSEYLTTRRRGDFQSKSEYQLKKFLSSGVFADSRLCKGSSFSESLQNWETILRVTGEWTSKINTFSGALEGILENLLNNSLVKHFKYDIAEEEKCKHTTLYNTLKKEDKKLILDQYRIHIIFGTLKDVTPFICYFDTGKGFSKYIVPELPRWLAKGPTEEEHEQGYGYWLIGKILSHIKGKFAFTIYEQDGNLNTTLLPADIRINELSKLIQYVSNNLLEEMKLGNLCEDNVRLIHWFIFETA